LRQTLKTFAQLTGTRKSTLLMSASEFNVVMQWKTAVESDGKTPYSFPHKFTSYLRETYAIPAVYQWRVLRQEGESKEVVYIGEAEDLIYRIQRVLSPPRQAGRSNTNTRLNEIFTKHVAAGRTIVLDIADIEPFEINGVRFGRDTMRDRFKRRMLENMVLVIAQESKKFDLLNMVVDPLDKVELLFKRLKPHERREIMNQYSASKTE
jgi:hypothetical protein